MKRFAFFALSLFAAITAPVLSQQTSRSPFTAETFAGLRARSIGPAVTSGRVMTIAVDPSNDAIIYIGAASGGVWKTVNGGASWQPVFDNEGSFSIGWVTVDAQHPNIVWVGTGERNSQRSVAYGDGVYKSEDGGRSWTNVGLKSSEHIGRIVINPKDSDTVYVAAQGPLWASGGDRGLYKTTDGGRTWNQALKISENTGVTDVVLDPRNPDVIVASAYQRRRHFFTLIDGGPESAIHRSTDGGKTWKKVNTGLPSEELGRIGLAISPVNPDVLYANVEAANGRGGIFRSSDNGVTWQKRTDYNSFGAMYYGDIFADPVNVDRVYIPDVIFQVTDDGGKSMRSLGQRNMHVDNHIIWVDPANTDHLLVGNDGGLYRSYDRGGTWTFFENLPLAQYYDVDVDNAAPFYNVYGGLQDNYSLGGPSRTRSEHGILNQDWFVTQGGDGFVSHVDPEDPNIIYAELQHGVIVRYDKRTGERIGIQPLEEKSGTPLRWNWDAPFIISPHLHTRLYFASQVVYRSDDRGNTWKIISPDLTREIDRNSVAVMGRIWGPDAVAKNTSTALYGNISAIAESPKKEGLLYVGTDDGLTQASEDGGGHWRKIDKLPGVPSNAYIARIRASQHDANTVYVAAENHQNGDFAPYLLKSTDTGRTWTSVAGDLPARGSTYSIAEDHLDPHLLFAGTEFAAYWSKDGGQHWLKIGGVPTIAVREIAIQKRENDLVLGTFGRGIYIVDDYSPVRATTSESVTAPATLYPVKDAVLHVPTLQYGLPGKAFQGEMLFAAPNPPYGAIFTYHLADGLKTLKQKRVDAEKAAEKAGQPIRYPPPQELRAEAEEEAPAILLTVMEAAGKRMRTITGPVEKGMQRVAWDLRAPAHALPPNRPRGEIEELFGDPLVGPYVVPGAYSATLSQRVGGVVSPLAGPVTFAVVMDPQGVQTMADHTARWQFQEKLQALRRDVAGSLELANSTTARLDAITRALDATPAAPRALHDQVRGLQKRLNAILVELQGDRALGSRSVPTPMAISERVNTISSEMNRTLGRPTTTHEQQYQIASDLIGVQRSKLRELVDTEIPALAKELERVRLATEPLDAYRWLAASRSHHAGNRLMHVSGGRTVWSSAPKALVALAATAGMLAGWHVTAAETAGAWRQWGGPNRNFIVDATGLAEKWPDAGPRVIWSRPLGTGHSAIVADQGRLFTMYRAGNGRSRQGPWEAEERVVALDAAAGHTIWEHKYPSKLQDFSYGAGPHSTPLIVGDRLFAIGTNKELFALDTRTGTVIWSHDLVQEFHAPSLLIRPVVKAGYGCSPIAFRDLIICSVGGPGQSVMAFRQRDGGVAWKGGDFLTSEAAPILITLAGKEQLVVFGGGTVNGLDPANGNVLWSHPHDPGNDLNCATPSWGGDILFLSSGYKAGSRAIRLKQDGDRTLAEEVWFSNRVRFMFLNTIRLGDYVYGSNGDLGPSFLTAIDVRTGQTAWQHRGVGRVSMVYADSKAIMLDEDGDLRLAKLTPEGVTILSQAKVFDTRSWTVPTLVGTTLYARDREKIVALDLGAPR